MAEVDINTDLEQINRQLEQLVGQLNTKKSEVEQLTQQIHNLNGIAMYLRGKLETDSTPAPNFISNNLDVDNLEDDS